MPIIISENTVDSDFINKVEEISGQPFHKCMQCGTCSGSCPMIEKMVLTPRSVLQMTNFGMKEKVSEANTVWLCASCHTCLVRCPRGLDLPKIMEAIRLLTLRKNQNYIEPFEIEKERIAELPPIALVSCFRKHTA
ncbi:4Fe-4S dicluster domain-containing protein [bacterium]|nr:4Fe-4S dicluster domain-containing protein [bacterium]